MIRCTCGDRDGACIISAVRVEAEGPSAKLWVMVRRALNEEPREFCMYLDANALVALAREAKTALMEIR